MLPRISTAAVSCFLAACSAQVDDFGFPASSYASFSDVGTGVLISREQLRRADLRYLAVSGLTPGDELHVSIKIGDKTHRGMLRVSHSRSQPSMFDFIRVDEKGVSIWRATEVFNRLIDDSDPHPVLMKASGSGAMVRFYQATPPPWFVKPV
jgi:hypothetical protein